MQIDALEKQRKFVYDELSPTKVNAQATAADVDRAKNRLALQNITDPNLLAARYAAEAKMLKGAEELGGAPSDKAAAAAYGEAMDQGTTGVAAQMKQKLIDAALGELEAGATLPDDVQAELVKAGLERSGTTLGAATSKGMGGNIQRSMVGERALALKAERQARAQQLSQSANALESSRNSLMLSLFPSLQKQQLSNLAASQDVLKSSAAELPPAGLSGESIANIWLARVGATNQLSQSAADAAARGTIGQATAWQQGLGGASQYAASAFPTISQTWGKIAGKSPAETAEGYAWGAI